VTSPSDDPAVSIILPVFNEGANITPVLRHLCASVMARPRQVLVVYDFDGDTTVQPVIALQSEMPEVELHRNQRGRGVLNAIRSGFAATSAPYVVVMMADGSDEPKAVDRMLALARAGADVVSASRYARGGKQVGGPRLKGLMSRAAGLSLHLLGALPIHDATNNFRLYSRRLLERVTIESTGGFELAFELTVKAHLLGMRVAEVPTTWQDRTTGQSHFRVWTLMPHYLHWYLCCLAARFRLRRAVRQPGG
jgi:dolichol-phosphate mannosyltransferase